MTAETVDGTRIDNSVSPNNSGIVLQDLSLFPEEIQKWLQPSPTVIHQIGLELINTRLLINQISADSKTPITIDQVSIDEWNRRLKHHDIVWFMGIYQPSEWSQHAMQYIPQYKPLLPDLNPEQDIVASPFAIPDYTPNPTIAQDWDAWDAMVDQLHGLKKKVFIDFVPNHTAVDHPWARKHPDFFIQGTQTQFDTNPSMYYKAQTEEGNIAYLAHGKDPNFPEWADTLQLNWANPKVQEEMEKILLELTLHADGVRCDMAMLLNAETFIRTWGRDYNDQGEWTGQNHLSEAEKSYIRENNFWQKIIPRAKERAKQAGKDDFSFVAEAYWDKDALGEYFDYIYGKDFYDHLKRIVIDHEPPKTHLRDHVQYLMGAVNAGRHYRDVLFTENHDEERAVKEFGEEPSKAVAALTGVIPESIFLLNQGQEEGRRIRPPMQIARFPNETSDPNMEQFYEQLLVLKRSRLFQQGNWTLADISTQNENVIALQVTINPDQDLEITHDPNHEVGAVIGINLGHTTASGRIKGIEKDVSACVYRLSKGDMVKNPDMDRVGGMYFELIPWETQIIFYDKIYT